MPSSAAFFQRIRDYLASVGGLRADQIGYVLQADSPALLQLGLVSEVFAPQLANVSQAVKKVSTPVQAVIVISGPREDGTTANTGTVFVGGPGVSAADGYPLAPGMSLAIDAVDLQSVNYLCTAVADRVRVLYLA